MDGYWWRCISCGHEVRCEQLLGCGVPTYIRNAIIDKDWDQRALHQKCPSCREMSLRITYAFPRKEREVVSALTIVGVRDEEDYVPMLWVSRPDSAPRSRWFHFNYMTGRNPYGLNRAAVFSDKDLRTIAGLYKLKTGETLFRV